MRQPEDLGLGELQEFVRQVQRAMDYRTEPVVGKYDGDAVREIRGLLADYGLAPDGQASDVEARVRGLVARLEGADDPGVQEAVDELVYDHVGTSKGASNINNGGYDAQVRALVERLGIGEAESLLAEVLGGGRG